MSQMQIRPDVVVYAGDAEDAEHGDREGDEIAGRPDALPRAMWRRGLLEPVLVLVIVGVAIAAAALPRRSNQPASPETQPAFAASTGESVQQAPPRLLAPATARPGESLTVFGLGDSTLCGPYEIRFDNVPVTHDIRLDRAARLVRWVELTITLQVPTTASPGTHTLQLYGPTPGGRGQHLCAYSEEHQTRLAESDITVIA